MGCVVYLLGDMAPQQFKRGHQNEPYEDAYDVAPRKVGPCQQQECDQHSRKAVDSARRTSAVDQRMPAQAHHGSCRTSQQINSKHLCSCKQPVQVRPKAPQEQHVTHQVRNVPMQKCRGNQPPELSAQGKRTIITPPPAHEIQIEIRGYIAVKDLLSIGNVYPVSQHGVENDHVAGEKDTGSREPRKAWLDALGMQ